MLRRLSAALQTFTNDALTLLLLGGALAVPAGAVITANWTTGLIVLMPVTLTAMLAGYVLSVSRFSDGMTIIIGMIFGAFTVWVVGALGVSDAAGWQEALVGVIVRAAAWFDQTSSGGFSRDNLIFVMLLAAVFWVLGLNAALNIFRARHLWPATVPPGLALLINNYYYTGAAPLDGYLIGYLFLIFTLAVATNAVNRAEQWRRQGIDFSGKAQIDLLRGGLIAAVALIAIAWSAPAASASAQLAGLWDHSASPWNQAQETWSRLFGGLEGAANTPDYYGGQTLSMGGPVSLGSQTVMLVSAPGGYRYYWRSKLFDGYANGRWISDADDRIEAEYGLLPPEEHIPALLRQNVQQRFEIVIPATRLLYAAPDPVAFASLPVTYDLIYTAGVDGGSGTVTTVRGKNPLLTGRVYNATSSISVADERSLRGAGEAYPAWVTLRYLALPGSVTPRTRDLALALTANAPTPYDKARALESFLRTTITYNTQVAPPPDGVEPVDYFLFESREGYCNYYASALAVMLRAVGIPARVAAGFAQGEFDPARGAFRVIESNAHSWVEAYFPRYGWIEFEPTASIEPIVRPENSPGGEPLSQPQIDPAGQPEAAAPTPPPQAGAGAPQAQASPGLPSLAMVLASIPVIAWCALSLGLAGVMLAGGAWAWVEFFDLRGLNEIQRAYARMNVAARWMRIPLGDTLTPHERGRALATIIPDADQPIQKIVDLYVQDRYGPPAPNAGEAKKGSAAARSAWERLWRIMIKAWVERQAKRLRPGVTKSG